ncbi:MAG: cupin domain-containing protein [Candidatus Eremiobacteraeota bacterium]|nr:cupin domain-containing protein [Candidatus Eremiobacteraeota bacterium]
MSRLVMPVAAVAALVATVAFGARVQAANGGMTVRYVHVFTVNDAPAGAWDVYLGASRISGPFWPGAHTHPGAEYGVILTGQGARWNTGSGLTTVPEGGAFNTSPGIVHEGGNTSDADALQLNTHILSAGGAFNVPAVPLPADAPKATGKQTVMYRVKFPMATHPANPFKMTMEVLDFAAGSQVPSHVPPGAMLGVVVDGRLTVTQNGTTKTYDTGQGIQVDAGTSVSMAPADGQPASVVVTAIAQ